MRKGSKEQKSMLLNNQKPNYNASSRVVKYTGKKPRFDANLPLSNLLNLKEPFHYKRPENSFNSSLDLLLSSSVELMKKTKLFQLPVNKGRNLACNFNEVLVNPNSSLDNYSDAGDHLVKKSRRNINADYTNSIYPIESLKLKKPVKTQRIIT